MSYVAGGDLMINFRAKGSFGEDNYEVLCAIRETITLVITLNLLRSLLGEMFGIEFLHSRGVIHR